MEQKCESCKFWRVWGEKRGECHRNAPLPMSPSNSPSRNGTHWPLTQHDQWCGEFQESQNDLNNRVEENE